MLHLVSFKESSVRNDVVSGCVSFTSDNHPWITEKDVFVDFRMCHNQGLSFTLLNYVTFFFFQMEKEEGQKVKTAHFI